jgi:hypothetical protein
MKNAVFSDVTLCGYCKNRSFGRTYHLHHQGEKNQLLVSANALPVSLILFTLTMEEIYFSETSVHTKATRRHITEDGILYLSLFFIIHVSSYVNLSFFVRLIAHLSLLKIRGYKI